MLLPAGTMMDPGVFSEKKKIFCHQVLETAADITNDINECVDVVIIFLDPLLLPSTSLANKREVATITIILVNNMSGKRVRPDKH